MLPAASPASRPPNPPFIRSLRPPGGPALMAFVEACGGAGCGAAPGWLPPKSLTALQASNSGIAVGKRVTLLARPRVIAEIEANGLRLTSFDGADQNLAANKLALSENPDAFSDAAIVLVTVKSADTSGMAEIIARHAAEDAVIVSLQNGVSNLGLLRAKLPGRR